MYTTLLTSLDNHIFTITINRPDKLNALNQQVMQELDKALDEVYHNKEIRSVIITGTGTKSFVAGADISEFIGLSEQQGGSVAQKGQDIFFKIENSPKPIVACVNGFALGGGCELALSCHFRIASENARFGQPEVNLGIIPGYGGTQRLTQLIGKGRALEMILSANLITAATALSFGLVNYVVAPEELLPKAISILTVINSKAPLAIAAGITAANAAFSADGYTIERIEFARCFGTEDMKEGVNAFLEKRAARFHQMTSDNGSEA